MRPLAFLAIAAASSLLFACGARTTGLTADDFTTSPGGDAGLDSLVFDSASSEVHIDSGVPLFDTRTADTFTPPPIDSGIPVDGGFDGGGPTDHTVGDPCKSDTDCDVTGDGIGRCSSGGFSDGSLYPTPVCLATECDPGDGTTISHCDGDKGICLSTGGGGSSGICLGICSFDTSGGAPKGCAIKDACNTFSFGDDATGALDGFGYCYGGCLADSDCTGGDRCQIETGLCVRRPVAYAKKVGDACTSADVSKFPSACNCAYVTTTNKGYCTQFCEMGTSVCPSGFTCDAFLPKTDPFSGGAGFVTSPKGLAGDCLKDCITDADCASLNAYCEENGGTGKTTCQPGTRP